MFRKGLLLLALGFAAATAAGACTALPLPGVDGGVLVDSGPPYVEPTLTEIQRRIITPSCGLMSCHGSESQPAARLGLRSGETHGNVVNQPATTRFDCYDAGVPDGAPQLVLVTPGNLAESFLWTKVNAMGDGELGPMCRGRQMPRTGQRLPQYALDAIRTWIEQGALDN